MPTANQWPPYFLHIEVQAIVVVKPRTYISTSVHTRILQHLAFPPVLVVLTFRIALHQGGMRDQETSISLGHPLRRLSLSHTMHR